MTTIFPWIEYQEPKKFAGIEYKHVKNGKIPQKFKGNILERALCLLGLHNSSTEEHRHRSEWALVCKRCGKIEGTGHTFEFEFKIPMPKYIIKSTGI